VCRARYLLAAPSFPPWTGRTRVAVATDARPILGTRARQRPFSTNLPHPYVETPRATPHRRNEITDRGCRSPIPAAPRRRIKSRSTRFLLAERTAAAATLLSPPRSLLSLRFAFMYKIIIIIILCTKTTATGKR